MFLWLFLPIFFLREGKHQVIAEKLANDKDPFAEQYKTSVRQIMDKGAARFNIGKRLRLTSDANNYDLHVLPEAVFDGGVTHTIIYFGIVFLAFFFGICI